MLTRASEASCRRLGDADGPPVTAEVASLWNLLHRASTSRCRSQYGMAYHKSYIADESKPFKTHLRHVAKFC
jgi:hypothetical protein